MGIFQESKSNPFLFLSSIKQFQSLRQYSFVLLFGTNTFVLFVPLVFLKFVLVDKVISHPSDIYPSSLPAVWYIFEARNILQLFSLEYVVGLILWVLFVTLLSFTVLIAHVTVFLYFSPFCKWKLHSFPENIGVCISKNKFLLIWVFTPLMKIGFRITEFLHMWICITRL